MAIPEISPREASQRLAQGAVLVDVREDHERATGMADGARGVDRATLERAPLLQLTRLLHMVRGERAGQCGFGRRALA